MLQRNRFFAYSCPCEMVPPRISFNFPRKTNNYNRVKGVDQERRKLIPRVVIDTNVVVSALLFGGTPGEVIKLWKNSRIKPFASKSIIQEYLRVFAYPKFELTENEITYLLYQEILPYFEVIDVTSKNTFVSKDPTDDKFVLCALKVNADIIISGDTHLLSLKKIDNIRVITPAKLLDLLPFSA